MVSTTCSHTRTRYAGCTRQPRRQMPVASAPPSRRSAVCCLVHPSSRDVWFSIGGFCEPDGPIQRQAARATQPRRHEVLATKDTKITKKNRTENLRDLVPLVADP